jgi:hypothetical protein
MPYSSGSTPERLHYARRQRGLSHATMRAGYNDDLHYGVRQDL